MKIRQLIEDHFLIDRADTGEFVPFRFNPVQVKYYDILCKEYLENDNFNGAREIILKARKEGFTSLILAFFCAIMLWSKHPVRFLEISYKDDATKQHYRRARNFILSFFCKDPAKWDKKMESAIFKTENEGSEFVLKHNMASFYVGTASARTGERGGTVQGLLFSEPAHYPNTEIIKAPEIIEGTRNMVAVGAGMIFQESTANGVNHFKDTWDMAEAGDVDYKPRFFSWRDFYSPEQFSQICKGFTDKALIKQEYPETAQEAFLSSGRHFLNQEILAEYVSRAEKPRWIGEVDDDGHTVSFSPNQEGQLLIWKMPKDREMFLISADVAEGVPGGAWSVAKVFSRSNWEVVAQWRGRVDPGQFGKIMCDMGYFWNNAVLAPELNNHGWATTERIRMEGYPHLLNTKDIWPEGDANRGTNSKVGFPTNDRTRTMIFSALSNAIDQRTYIEHDLVTLREMQKLVKDERGKVVVQQGWMDCTISAAIGLYCLKFLTVDETYREDNQSRSPIRVTSLVSKPKSRGGYR